MAFGRMNRRARESPTVVEEVAVGEEVPTCTFDDDADPSIERCWADEPSMMTKNDTSGVIAATDNSSSSSSFMMLGMAGVTVVCLVAVLALLWREFKAKQQKENTVPASEEAKASIENGKSSAKEQPPGQEATDGVRSQPPTQESESRVKELKMSLERETKEKQGLSEQNNFLRSALEERKATVQMFTTELQSRDEQLANFEQEQIKVKNELYNQIEVLKSELQVQEKHQQKNLNNMDGQCADLASKVEGLMKELANREEQWETFEKEAKAKEHDSATQIDAIKKEYAAKEQAQKAQLASKDKECAEMTAQLEALAQSKRTCQQKLEQFAKQRAKWNAATVEMKRLLKEKREEIVGLTTRMELFMGELQSREGRVASLEQKLLDKNDLTASQLEDLRKVLKEQQADHEAWSGKTADISKMLGECEAESKDLATKLAAITKELKSTSATVADLEAKVENREFVRAGNKVTLAKSLAEEQAQRAHWTEQHLNIQRLLKERQEECASITARVEIFAAELKSRETIVGNLQAKCQDKAKSVASHLRSMEKDVKGAQAFRDTWSNNTKGIHGMLQQKKEEIVGLSTRVDLFQIELTKREERVAALESVLHEKEEVTAATLEPYQTQLKTHQADLDKWHNNTAGIKQLLKDRKGECIGLTTRLHLFKQKVTEYEGNVKEISEKVRAKEGSHTTDIGPLRAELEKQQAEREKWNTQTIDIGNSLKDRQGQCVGLTTRLALFQQQTKYHEEQVAILSAKSADLEERFRLKLDPLRKELLVQREGLESWRESTKNVESLLAQAKQDCVDLTAELKTNVAKLQGCQKEVASLQAQVIAKADYISSNEDEYEGLRKVEEQELENWASKTKDLEQLLKSKENQIPGLTTRVSLFNTELSTRQTAVIDLENKIKERGDAFQCQISSLRNELKFQREQRDHCLEATLTMNRSMKEVKEPCVGLTTRLALFRKELEGREERVKILTAQVNEKEELARSEIDPIKSQLEKKREDRDDWNESTNGIFQSLKTKKESVTGLTTRLELFMSELQKKEEAVEAAEESMQQVEKGLAQIDDLETEIKSQEEQREKWEKSTEENVRLLEQKQEQRSMGYDKRLEQECASLSAKVELFKGELQRREDKVKELKATSKHRGETLASEKVELEKQIPALKDDRDGWMEKTFGINKTLKDTQAEVVDLTSRWDLLKVELKKKTDEVESLAALLKQKEEHHSKMIEPYKNELKVQTDLREKWLETTDKMDRLLKKKESECVTFTTQLETAIDELSSRKEQVANLETRLSDAMDLSDTEMTSLKKQLAAATDGLDAWRTSTVAVEKSLKDTRQECANLKVRLQVFHRQVATQDGRIASLEAAYNAKKDDVNAQMDALKAKLKEQQTARDESVSNTLTINKQIKDKEMQCTSITVRLSLFRTELENREKNVAVLESKLADTEGMSKMQLDPVKAQLEQQKDELAKWIENTNDIEQTLKARDEERIGLATRLQLFQLQLQTIEESVAKLEERVREREENAAEEITPFKNALQAQQAERDRWTKCTMDIVNLLKDRKTQITGLTVRLSLFRKEVKHREGLVATIESKLREKESELNSTKIDPVKKELAVVTKERDQWAKTTAGLVKMLDDKHNEVGGLNVRLQCFKMELQKREEACNVLVKKYEDEKKLYGSQAQVLKSELAMQMEQRDKWRETTAEMRKQLEDRRAQCTGLKTRVELFQKEIRSHDATIADLKEKVEENDAAIAEVEELKKELKVQTEHRDSLSKAAEETGQLLKTKKEQCAGLATRLVVFRQQLKDRIDRLNATETRIKEKEELSNAQIESLKIDLQSQKEQRNKWSETTEELKKLLEEKENQCSVISAELELLTALQSGEAV